MTSSPNASLRGYLILRGLQISLQRNKNQHEKRGTGVFIGQIGVLGEHVQ